MLGKRFPLAHLRALTPDERFDEDLAQLERTQPHLVVTDMAKEKRAGRVFIDWSQNADHKTTVAVYSLRAKRDQPVVSLPVAWAELERAIATRKPESLYCDPDTALRRLSDVGDMYRPVAAAQATPAADSGQAAQLWTPSSEYFGASTVSGGDQLVTVSLARPDVSWARIPEAHR